MTSWRPSARRALRAVVDTNVWVSGLIIPGGAPGAVLELVRTGRIEVVASWALVEELLDVLKRPKLRRYRIAPADADDLLALLTPLLPSMDVRVPVRDPDDAPVVAAALSGRADAIITGDADFTADTELIRWLERHGVETLTPRAALDRLA